MDKQEPTFGKPELSEIEFRPRSGRKSQRSTVEDSNMWLKVVIEAAVLVAIAMGLIEWNARRQAAAFTAELTRPMTPEEAAKHERWEAEMAAETARELAEVRREIWIEPQPRQIHREPLRPGQRCMQGRRIERIEGGWRDIPNSPC